MRGSVRGIGILALVVVVIVSAWLLRPRPSAPVHPAPAIGRVPAAGQAALNPSAKGAAGTTSNAAQINAPERLEFNGVLEATEQAVLSVAQPARITALLVHVGAPVRRGQVLVRLDATAALSQERSAQAGVTAAAAQLAKAKTGRDAQRVKADADAATAKEGLRQAQERQRQAELSRDAARAALQAERTSAQENVRKAQTGLTRAQETLRGLEALAKVGGVSRNDLEGARAQVETAQSDLTQAQVQVRALEAGTAQGTPYRVALAEREVALAQSGVRQARDGLRTALRARQETSAVAEDDVRAAAAAVEQARAGLEGARVQTGMSRLVSPLDGLVSAVTAHTGETAQPGAPILTVVAPQGLRAAVLVPARQLPRLHIGQNARIDLDARPGQPLKARIAAISRVAEPDGRSFRVTLRLIDPPSDLRIGQTVAISL